MKISRRVRKDAGQALPLIALCLAALMGFAGLAVDVGYWEYNQRQQQSAADAAALGGAQQLIYAGCPNQSVAATAGKKDASQNGFTDNGNTVTVTIQNPPPSGPFSSNNCAVQAQVYDAQVATFFTRLFGHNGIPETTQATAQVVADNNGCIFMLAPSQNTNFNGSNINAPKCAILMNGSANFNDSTVDAASIGEANYSGSNNGGTFTGGSPASMLPVADPCPEIAGCAYLTNNPPPTSPCNGVYSGNGTLPSGCYSNLNMNGQTVTLQSGGLFIFEGSANFNGASITGSGVTIYIPAGSTPPNFNKVGSLSITPPASGNYAGVSYYQVPSNTGDINFNGSNTNVGGLIYAPGASMNYNGSVGQYTVIVAAYANFNKSGGTDFGNPVAGQTLIKNAVLTQ